MLTPRHYPTSSKRNKQRGVALLLCLFALLLLTGVALAMLFSADTETSINANYRDAQVAYFAAQAGISEAVDRLMTTGGNGIVAPTAMPTVANGQMFYIVNPKSATESVQPWSSANGFRDTELCKEGLYSTLANNGVDTECPATSSSFPAGTAWYTTYNSISPGSTTSSAVDFKWVRISLKGNGSMYPYYVNNSSASGTLGTQVCSDGSKQSLLAGASCGVNMLSPVWILTSLAVTPLGSRRMVQVELTKIQMPPLPGALTLDGPGSQLTPPYDAPNSNNFFIAGAPPAGCGSTVPAIVTTDNGTQGQVISAIPSNRRSHYTGVQAAPDVETILPAGLPQGWQTPADAEAVIAALQSAANPANVYNGPQSNISIGSQSTPQITVVNGDLTMTGNTRGGGILIVTGTLTMSGNSGFYGVILVVGSGTFVANGGGNGQYNGAMLVAKTRDANGHVLSSMGDPVVDWSGGGGNGIQYDGCAISNVQQNLGFKTMASRELMY
jgi:Tfp pilus assembly protein PilX